MKTSKAANRFEIQTYFFNLIGSSIAKHRRQFKMKPNAMRKILSEIIEIDISLIECNTIVAIENGLQYGFTIFAFEKASNNEKLVNGNTRVDILMSLYNAVTTNHATQQSVFIQRVINEWKLNSKSKNINSESSDVNVTTIVTLYDTHKQDDANDVSIAIKRYQRDYTKLIDSSFYQNNSQMFSFDKIGNYQSIRIDKTIAMAPRVDARLGPDSYDALRSKSNSDCDTPSSATSVNVGDFASIDFAESKKNPSHVIDSDNEADEDEDDMYEEFDVNCMSVVHQQVMESNVNNWLKSQILQ